MARTEKKADARVAYQLEAEHPPLAGNPGKPLETFFQQAKAGMDKLKQQRPANWRPRKGTAR